MGASESTGLGDEVARLGEGERALAKGGGSIEECEFGTLEGMTGSGKAGISSSDEAVSIVICFVAGLFCRSV